MLQIPKFIKALEARAEHLAQHTNGTQTLALAISSAGVTVPNCDASVQLLACSWDSIGWIKKRESYCFP